jgi:membrane-bound lytic murein transglycosylase A
MDGQRQTVPADLKRINFSELVRFAEDDLASARAAFCRQAREILEHGSGFSRTALFAGERQDWVAVAQAALAGGDPRQFFETCFVPFVVTDHVRPAGLFTGYYEPEVEGSRERDAAYPVPIYRKPRDLVAFTPDEAEQSGVKYGCRVDGRPAPYIDRRAIEAGALADRGLEICWLRSWVEAFFMHIQGSGRVRLPDGGALRLSYAAKSGLPYTGIGGVLADRGILTRETMSMQTVKAWLAENPQSARELMWLNQSYVFFREIEVDDPALGAVGAARVNLTPQRSLAVDRAIWAFGTPFWIETSYPPEARRTDRSLRRLLIAQDTGSAIKGVVRGDFYWGWGDDAALVAGHMKSPGRMTVLLPHAVAERLGLAT